MSVHEVPGNPHRGRGSGICFETELNPQQLEAVRAGPGRSLVLAGAGAGKTRTLTYRVAWLLDRGMAPDRILLLTFTNRAAREMMQRVSELVGGDVGAIWGGTFHSLGFRIVRRHADRLGYPGRVAVLDREDARELLGDCINELGIDVRATRFPKAEALGEMLSVSVNSIRPVADLLDSEYSAWDGFAEAIGQVVRRYADRKREAGLLDFDDLLAGWRTLMESEADLRELYQRKFQWVLVDEYQDTNVIQGRLIDLVSGVHGNLMAVGDDAQSIYSWRGAHFANILEFPRRHPGSKVFRIETNYRSTPEILAVANASIAGNRRQFPKNLEAVRESGPRPVVLAAGDSREQAWFVAERIGQLVDEGRSLRDFCVLYRSHFHALEMQFELTRRGIPFHITSGIRFFEQAHIKDAVAYLKLLENPRDELAVRRLARMLPGVGTRTAEKLGARWRERVRELPAEAGPAVGESDNDGGDGFRAASGPRVAVAPLLAAVSGEVPRKAAGAWAALVATVAECETPGMLASPSAILRHVVRSGYEEYVSRTYENARNRLDDLEQLAAYAAQFPSLGVLLSELALQSDIEAAAEARRQAGRDDEDRVRLSTIHQAKGLEFGVVFLIMLCEGLFPSARSMDSTDAEEEERRLFYVAVTRARDQLYLSYPRMRSGWDGGGALQLPSRFLAEIPGELLDGVGGAGRGEAWTGSLGDGGEADEPF